MSSPNDNEFQTRVNNITDLRECISGSREQLGIVRTAADRALMLQQRGLQLNRGVTRNENDIAVELSENEQLAYDIHQDVEEGHNNLEEMVVDSSPSDSPSQLTDESASPDSNHAPAAVPAAGPPPAAPPAAPPAVPIPVAPANNPPRLTANQLCANAPALVATIPAILQNRGVQECARIVATYVARAQAAAAAAAASPADANLRTASELAHSRLQNARRRQGLWTRVCVHCHMVSSYNENTRRHLREYHYVRDPRYNHLNRAERRKVAQAEAP
ncbi:hypothetical protein CGCSCA1_v005734 [Colletotrichum siamense]|nr:hypothetical protein CGCSCA1_v005734 [Colletotrichum siamense]